MAWTALSFNISLARETLGRETVKCRHQQLLLAIARNGQLRACQTSSAHQVLSLLVYLFTGVLGMLDVIFPPFLLQNIVKMQGINEHITCRLCAGYLIDATTITECLHTCESAMAYISLYARNISHRSLQSVHREVPAVE
jgi:hypothetical protein